MSTGPHTINSGDSIKVAFALIAGDDLVDLIKSADSAQVHYNGTVLVGIKKATNNEFGLIAYPNPAGNQVNFSFVTEENSSVDLQIMNALGQSVMTVVKSEMTSGTHKVTADITNLPNGTYFYRLISNDKMLVRKLIINK